MTTERIEQLLNNISEGEYATGSPNEARLINVINYLQKRDSDLINHYQGVMSDLMLSIAQAQEAFLRLRGLVNDKPKKP